MSSIASCNDEIVAHRQGSKTVFRLRLDPDSFTESEPKLEPVSC